MSMVDKYETDIIALEELNRGPLGSDPEREFAKAKEIFAPLLSAPGAVDVAALAEQWWRAYAITEVAQARKYVELQRRLMPLYDDLSRASPAEWEAFASLRVKARTGMMVAVLRMLPLAPPPAEAPSP